MAASGLEQERALEQVRAPEQVQALEQARALEQVRALEQARALEQEQEQEQEQVRAPEQALEQVQAREQVRAPERARVREPKRGRARAAVTTPRRGSCASDRGRSTSRRTTPAIRRIRFMEIVNPYQRSRRPSSVEDRRLGSGAALLDAAVRSAAHRSGSGPSITRAPTSWRAANSAGNPRAGSSIDRAIARRRLVGTAGSRMAARSSLRAGGDAADWNAAKDTAWNTIRGEIEELQMLMQDDRDRYLCGNRPAG